MKKPDKYYDPENECIVIGKKKYIIGRRKMKKIDGIEHTDFNYLVEVDEDADKEILDEIVEKVKGGVSVEVLLRQVIKKKLPLAQRKKLLEALKDDSAEIKEQEGCYGLLVGKNHFQLIE